MVGRYSLTMSRNPHTTTPRDSNPAPPGQRAMRIATMLYTDEVRLPAAQAEKAGAATLLGDPPPGFEPPPAHTRPAAYHSTTRTIRGSIAAPTTPTV